MPILLNCSACGHRRYAPEEEIPHGVRCPKCDVTFMDPIVPRIGGPGARRTVFKIRHTVALASLLVIVVASAIIAIVCFALAAAGMVREGPLESLRPWLLAAQGLLCLLNAGCALALLLWKTWGFYGLIASLGISFILTLTTDAILAAGLLLLLALGVIGGLYVVLQLGTPSTWSQLE